MRKSRLHLATTYHDSRVGASRAALFRTCRMRGKLVVARLRVRLRRRSADPASVARPFAIASGILLALALVALPGWTALHYRDAPPPDDRDLRAAQPPASSDNGFAQFVAAADAAQLPKDEATWRRFHAFRAGTTWEPEWIAELVAQNAPATALLRAGLAAPVFAFPPPGGASDDRMKTLFRLQQLVALSGARARILLREGRGREAIELASLGLRVGKRVSSADNVDLFGIYMAGAYQTVALLDLEFAARSTRVDAQTARELGALLEETRWRASDWQRVWGLEYQQLIASLATIDIDGVPWPIRLLPSAYRFQPNRTASALADLYREQSRKSARACAHADLARSGELLALPTAIELFAPNALGRIVIREIRARNFDQVQRKRCQFETHVSLVEALIAAKAYSDAEGRLPAQLADLAPRYLDAPPLDHFDGEPLRYAVAAHAVWSVGEDYSNEGGGTAPNPLDPHQPAVSLAF
jgi:hypothetical protein